jgi:hypothetical protein
MSDDEDLWFENWFRVGIARVPIPLLNGVAVFLHGRSEFEKRDTMIKEMPRAWMGAISSTFPKTSLAKLRARDPFLVPAWLAQGFDTYQVQSE